MFIAYLTFADNRAAAPDHLAAHKQWIEQGFAEGAFLAVGKLLPASGGAILGRADSREAFEARIAADPFVIHGVVAADIQEMDVWRTQDGLADLMAAA
ncbi:YciI family protein [Sphingopyxis sp. MWB1]|uniref:YciI family protein n=1 Tax=Sphingopyxis sp. MWB1 TaxID=1537715 RepID=UPI00051A72E0|nr:YciI family protein [Sphingopyxis sp. MWB1]